LFPGVVFQDRSSCGVHVAGRWPGDEKKSETSNCWRSDQELGEGGDGIALVPALAVATPSTTYWAPSVATCQAKYVPHITYDTYYGKGTPHPVQGRLRTRFDTGLTMGVLPWDKLQAGGRL